MNWELYKNFTAKEFACQHCGKEGVKEELLNRLQALRTFLDFSFIVSSGYRCPNHPIEAKKSKPGTHATGLAVDIQALALIKKVIVGLFTWILQIIQKKNQDLLFGVIKWQERL